MPAPANPADEPDSDDNRDAGRDLDPGAAGRIRLLVLDIDGTVSNSRHEIEEATVQAVARVREAGIAILLATGRRYRDVLPVAARLGIEGPLVTASGALVKRTSDHATLFRASFDPGALALVLERIDARGLEPILYTDSFAEGFDFHCRRLPGSEGNEPPRGVGEYLARNRHLARIDPGLDRHPPTGVFAGEGNRAEIYVNPDPLPYVELETLGHLRRLRIGESTSCTNFYRLDETREGESPKAAARRLLESAR